ncbi:MarR family winged helix-turn-helix transcriptional regulator [Cryptosporangium sp. NPDC048952]|uniref:MarR family winged helix-turn-helix transcriptional regulator n=1 Tax=Cryptosporangium sp. NPDC048952 TaxID=3363961 RepID=UPI00371E9FA4
MSTEREALVRELDNGGRALATAAVLFHTAVAALSGLSASDQRALDLIERFGPLTAGELAERSGLAPASVTGLLARLERKGLARRVPNPNDRRSVLVELVYEQMAVMGPHFLDLGRQLHQLYETFSVEEMQAIARFLREASQIQQDAATRIPSPDQ